MNLWVPQSSYAPTSNPNLLDNWYFTSPINQKGFTEYYGIAYMIDRWKGQSARTRLRLMDDCIRLSRAVGQTSTAQISLTQILPPEIAGFMWDKTVTLSMLIKACTARPRLNLYTSNILGVVSDSPQLLTNTITLPSAVSESFSINIGLEGVSDDEAYVDIIAAKLEFGAQSTLAHQDISGNWILSDLPPNNATELVKCQRYQIQFVNTNNVSYGMVGFGSAVSETRCSVMIPSPCPISKSGILVSRGNWTLFSGENALWKDGIPVTRIREDYSPANGVCAWVDVASGLTAGKSYYLAYSPTSDDIVNYMLYDMNL